MNDDNRKEMIKEVEKESQIHGEITPVREERSSVRTERDNSCGGQVNTCAESVDFSKMEENYNYYAELLRPDIFHCGNVTYTNRLLGYIDAMMATCGTFLVIPLTHLKHMKKDESLVDYFMSEAVLMLLFFLGFLLVCTIWESINFLNLVFRQADHLFLILVILKVCFASLLPLGIRCMGYFYLHKTDRHHIDSVLLTCVILIAINVVEFIKTIYAFWSKKILHVAIQSYSKDDLNCIRNTLFIRSATSILLCIVTALCSLIGYEVSWALIILMLLMRHIHRGIFCLQNRFSKNPNLATNPVLIRFREGVSINKERVEAFTDAAFAVIACVLILDLTTKDFPEVAHEIEKHGVWHTMATDRAFVAFISCYAMISIHWFFNHIVLHHFHTIDDSVLILQKLLLFSISYFPFVAQCLHKFWDAKSNDTQFAVIIASSNSLICGLCNLLIVLRGLYLQERAVHSWVFKDGGSMGTNIRKNIHLILWLFSICFWSLVCLIAIICLQSFENSVMVFRLCFYFAFGTILLLKLVYMCRKATPATSVTPDSGTSQTTGFSNNTEVEEQTTPPPSYNAIVTESEPNQEENKLKES